MTREHISLPQDLTKRLDIMGLFLRGYHLPNLVSYALSDA